MIRIWYDPANNTTGVTGTGELSAEEMVRAGAMIVNGMVCAARAGHGEATAEKMLMLIRNMDDAGVFGLDAVGR